MGTQTHPHAPIQNANSFIKLFSINENLTGEVAEPEQLPAESQRTGHIGLRKQFESRGHYPDEGSPDSGMSYPPPPGAAALRMWL